METNNNNNIVELDLRVSCSIFWNYQMKLTINRDDFIEPDFVDNINRNNGCCDHSRTPVFSRLERIICDAMISYIHEDLAMNGDEAKIQQLCDISSNYHIHGHTTNSLLNLGREAIIYICSHC
jgi:hypothetical protein